MSFMQIILLDQKIKVGHSNFDWKRNLHLDHAHFFYEIIFYFINSRQI